VLAFIELSHISLVTSRLQILQIKFPSYEVNWKTGYRRRCDLPAADRTTEYSWFDTQWGQENFLLGNVQSGSGSHPVFWSMGTGVLSLRVERLGRETDLSLPLGRSGAIPPLSQYTFLWHARGKP